MQEKLENLKSVSLCKALFYSLFDSNHKTILFYVTMWGCVTKTRGTMTNWPFVVFLPIAIAASKMTVELIIVGVGSGLHIERKLGNLSG